MTRTHLVSLMALVVAVPAATAGSFFSSSARPCFVADTTGYEISAGAQANYIVRIDNTAPAPSLRMQLVDDPAAADFVLVDDGDAAEACKAATAIKSIRLDPTAAKADLTVALSQQPADYKIYVRSANFTAQQAAALFAVVWQNARKTGQNSGQNSGLAREIAARQ